MRLRLSALALLGASGILAILFVGDGRQSSPRVTADAAGTELAALLGPRTPSRPLETRPASHVRVAVRPDGYRVVRSGSEQIQLAGAVSPATPWTRHRDGVSRARSFGRETIVVTSRRTEQFYTVTQRQGTRTWSWRLTTPMTPSLTAQGTVAFRGSDLTIRPAAILDESGRVVTPAKTGWKLAPAGKNWRLTLSFDDSSLPLPYVIDPAVDYPQTLYFSDADAPSVTGTPTTPATNGGTTGAERLATTTQQNAFIGGGAAARAAAGTQIVDTKTLADNPATRTAITSAACTTATQWGTSTGGQAFTTNGTASANCAVVNGTGATIGNTANNTLGAAYTTTSTQDQDIRSTVTLPTFAGAGRTGAFAWGYLLRGSATASVRVEFLQAASAVGSCTGGTATNPTTCVRVGSGSVTTAAGTYSINTGTLMSATAPTGNTPLHTRAQLIGNTLKVKYWTGTTEPATWGATFDVSSLFAGGSPPVAACTTGCLTGVFSYRQTNIVQTTTWTNINAVTATNQTGFWAFQPGKLDNTTRIASLTDTNSDFSGNGWIVDPGVNTSMGATGIPSTTYTIRAVTNVPGATFDAGDTRLVAQFFTVDVSGAGATSNGTVITPSSAGAATTLVGTALESSADARTATGSSVTTIVGTLPAMTLPQGKTLFVQLYREQKDIVNAPLQAETDMQLLVNQQAGAVVDSANATKLTLGAAADDTAPTATVDTPASNGTAYGPASLPANIAGTASDANTISSVKVAIRESVTSNYLDAGGTTFNSATPNYLSTGGTTASWTLATSGFAAALVNGRTYTITVQATDQFGNTTNTAATRTFTYDSTAPTGTITTPPSNGTSYRAGTLPSTFAGTSDDGTGTIASVEVAIQESGSGNYLNAGKNAFDQASQTFVAVTSGTTSWSLNTSDFAAALQTNSTYTITLRATDAAGNVNASAATRTFVYDTAAPTATVTTPPSDGTAYRAATLPGTFTGTSDDAAGGSGVASVQLAIQESGSGNYLNTGKTAFDQATQTFVAVTSGTTAWSLNTNTFAAALQGNHTYTITVKTTDTAGNTSSSAATRTFVYDTAAPTAAVTTPAASAAYRTATLPATFSGTADDAAGGSGVASVQIAIQESGSTNYLNTGKTAFDQASQTFVAVTSGTTSWSLDTSDFAAALQGNHTYTITVKTTDTAGNTTNAATRTFIFDTTAPTAAVTTPAASAAYRTATLPATLSGTADDAAGGSGVASVQIAIQESGTGNYLNTGKTAFDQASQTFVAVTSGTTSWSLDTNTFAAALQDGRTYTLTVKTTDAAGNTSSSAATRTFIYDTTAPTAAGTSPASGASYNAGSYPGTTWAGTAVDPSSSPSGVATVQVSIKAPNNDYWQAVGGFAATAEVWLNTTVSSGWTLSGAPATLDLTQGTYTVRMRTSDNAGNSTNASPASFTFTYDTTAPTVTSVDASTANGTYSTDDNVDVVVHFSENVVVTGTPRLRLAVGGPVRYATYLSGSASNALTFRYTVVAGDNSSDLDYFDTAALGLNGGTIRDAATNDATLTLASPGAAGSLGANAALVISTNTSVKDVTSTTIAGSYKAGTTHTIGVEFTTAVDVTGTPTLTLNSGGSASYTGGTGTTTLSFTYTVLATQNASNLSVTTINLPGGATINNGATPADLNIPGGHNLADNVAGIKIDTTAPAVTSATTSVASGYYKATSVIPITINFSEAVIVTGTPTLTLNTTTSSATVNYVSGSGTTQLLFTYTVGANQNTDAVGLDVSSINLSGGTIRDAATNGATLTIPANQNIHHSTAGVVIDTTPPSVVDISAPSTPAGFYPAGTVIPITVQFSENVSVNTGGGTPSLTLNLASGATTATYASGTGTSAIIFNYTVQAGDNTALAGPNLNVTAISLNSGTIGDLASNPAGLTIPSGHSLSTNTPGIVVDTTAPTVVDVTTSTAAGFYPAGTAIPIAVKFAEIVNVTGTPTLTLNSGATVNYSSGTGTATLTFSYTVGASDNSPAGLDVSSINVTGAAIKDRATNTATLTIPGGQNLVDTKPGIVVDTTPPAVTQITTSTNAGAYSAGTVIPITVTFGEIVNVTGTPTVTLNSGATVNYSSGSGTASLTFSYTVAAGNNAAGGLNVTGIGGTIKDRATNDGNLALPTGQNLADTKPGVVIDTTPPTVTSVTGTNGLKKAGQTVDIVVHFSEAATVNTTGGTPSLSLNIPGGASAAYLSGSGTTDLTFRYTVSAGHNVSDLDYASTAPFQLNGGTIKDAATNNATLTGLATPGAAGSLGASNNIVIDTLAPLVDAAAVSGSTITLTFDETLAGTTSASDWSAKVNLAPATLSAATFVSGNTMTLTLQSAVSIADVVTVSYTGTTLTDTATNALAAFSNQPVSTGGGGGTPPHFSSATTNGAGSQIVLTFDATLYDTSSLTPGSAFVVSVGGVPQAAPTSVAVSGSTVTLTLAASVTDGQSVTVEYNPPGAALRLRDASGNNVAHFGPSTVTNTVDTVAPSFVSATTNAAGTQVAITMSEPIRAGQTLLPGDFTLAGGPSVTAASYSGSTITLAISPAATEASALIVGYNQAVAAPNQIVDAAGNVTGSWSNKTVTNAVDTTPPAVSGASIDGATLTIAFTEGVAGSPATGDFTVKVDGVQVNVTGVTVSGTHAVLTLASPVTAAQVVTVAYTQGASHIDDAAGNAATSFPATAVSNETSAVPAAPAAPPTIDSASPADGSTISSVGQISITASTSVSWSNVTVTRPDNSTATFAAGVGTTATFAFAATAPGLYTVSGTIVAQVTGASADFQTHFTIFVPPASGGSTASAPPVQATAEPDQPGTVTTADGSSTLTWPAGAFGGDAVIVELEPLPPGTTNLPPNSIVVDVTAFILSSGASVHDLSSPIELLFRNPPPGMSPRVSENGTDWRDVPELSAPQLPAGQPDGFFRDGSGGIHIYTRHLTFFALTGQAAQTKLAMRIISAPRVSSVRKFIAVHLDLTAPARVRSWFVVDSTGKAIPNTSQVTRTLRSGVTILRLRLPNLRPGTYRLQVRADGAGQSTARTARLRIVKTRPWTASGPKPLGIVVTGPKPRQLHQLQTMLGPQFDVRTTIGSLLFTAVDPRTTRTAAVVVDLDTVPLATVAGLHAVFPELQIIGLASDPASARKYRRAGATVVLAKPASAWAVRQSLRQLILRNP